MDEGILVLCMYIRRYVKVRVDNGGSHMYE